MATTTAHWHSARYLLVWGALLVLTFATWGLHHLVHGAMALPTAMIIAFVKSSLVALFFMELWDHKGISRLVFVISLAFVLILMAGAIADVITRFPLAIPNPPAGPPGTTGP